MTTTEDLTALLDQYFVGPIAPAIVDKLQVALSELEQHPARRAGEESSFRANGRRHQGELWRERLARGLDRPGPRELAIWVAASRTGYPSPRPYCPEPLVGTWTQVAPTPAQWKLSLDGSLETTDRELGGSDRWRVHRLVDGEGPEGDELWVSEGRSRDFESLIIKRLGRDEIELLLTGTRESTPYRWRRA